MKIRETHRVVVMGGGGVGKTCLVTQFMEGTFVNSYKPTVEDYYRHTVKTPDGRIHTVEIVDTSGTHVFPAMRDLSIRSGKAFILVFAIDNMQSFHQVITLWDLIKKVRGGSEFPIVLVGNKSDLPRQVPLETIIQTKAEYMNNCPYIETSAKYNLNVIKLFIELLQQANKLVDEASSTPELRRRKLSRRLSSFSSLPNISLIRRRSGTSANNSHNSKQQGVKQGVIKQSSESSTSSCSSPFAGRRGVGGLLGRKAPSLQSHTKPIQDLIVNNVNCLVDEGMTSIRRAVINGIDTISLSDGPDVTSSATGCVIL